MILLKISFKLLAHSVSTYDRIWAEEVLPLIREHGFKPPSVWRSLIGPAQEYLEIWEFDSLADYENRWRRFMADPRLQAVFQKTGPLVLDEQLTAFDPVFRP